MADKITADDVWKRLTTSPPVDDRVKKLAEDGSIEKHIFSNLILRQLSANDIRDLDFRFVGRGRSKAKVLLLIETPFNNSRVIKCGLTEIISQEALQFDPSRGDDALALRMDGHYRPSFHGSIEEYEQYSSISFSFPEGCKNVITLRDCLADQKLSVNELLSAFQNFGPFLTRWQSPRIGPALPFGSFEWRQRQLEGIPKAIAAFKDRKPDSTVDRLSSVLEGQHHAWRSKLGQSKGITGISHGDLNAHNVLIGRDLSQSLRVFVIDFFSASQDKRSPATDWAKLERDIKFRSLRDISQSDHFCRAVETINAGLKNHSTVPIPQDDSAKCFALINELRSQYRRFFTEAQADICSIEYLYYLLCWNMAYLADEEFIAFGINGDTQTQNAIVQSALDTFDALEDEIANFGSPREPRSASFDIASITSTPQHNNPEPLDLPQPSPHARPRPRRATLISAFVLSILVIIGAAIWIQTERHPSQPPPGPSPEHGRSIVSPRTTIYLAHIDGPNADKYPHITDALHDALTAFGEQYSDIDIVLYDRPVNDRTVKSLLPELASQHVSLLIWGRYEISDTNVLIHLQYEPLFLLSPFSTRQDNLTYSLGELNHFEITTVDLPKYINSVILPVEGMALLMHGDFSDAERAFKAAHHAFNERSLVINKLSLVFWLVIAQMQQGHLHDAELTLKEQLRRPQSLSKEIGAALYVQYVYLLQAINPSRGADICRLTLSNYLTTSGLRPEDRYSIAAACGRANYVVGSNDVGDQFRKRGLDILGTLPAISPSDFIFLGDSYAALCDLDSALVNYHKSAELDPSNTMIFFRIGQALAAKGDSANASRAFALAQGSLPGSDVISIPGAGGISLVLDAMHNASVASGIGPTPNPRVDAAVRLTAISSILKAIAIHPRVAFLYYKLGDLYEDNGNDQDALINYDKALHLDPESVFLSDAYDGRGRLLSKMGKTTEARNDFTKAISLAPRSVMTWLYAGRFFVSQNDRTLAMGYLNKGVKLATAQRNVHSCMIPAYFYNPQQHAAILQARGEALFLSGELSAAMRDFDAAIEVSDQAAAHYDKAVILKKMRAYADAMKEVDRAIRLNRTSPEAYALKGDLFLSTNASDGAIEAYGYALNLSPHSESALFGQAVAYESKRDWEKAEHNYAILIQNHPKDMTYLARHGFVLHKLTQAPKGL